MEKAAPIVFLLTLSGVMNATSAFDVPRVWLLPALTLLAIMLLFAYIAVASRNWSAPSLHAAIDQLRLESAQRHRLATEASMAVRALGTHTDNRFDQVHERITEIDGQTNQKLAEIQGEVREVRQLLATLSCYEAACGKNEGRN